MKGNEKKLLIILLFVIILAVFYIPIYSNLTSSKDYQVSISKYTQSIENLQKQNTLYSKKTEDTMVLEQETLPLSDIADLILSELKTAGIVPDKYQLNENKNNNYVDFTISCSTNAFITYLSGNQDTLYPYTLINTTISTYPGEIKATLRYTNKPSQITASEKSITKKTLISHFPPKKTELLPVQKDEPLKQGPVIEDGNSLYKCVGYIKENNSNYLFIKTIETGKIIKILDSKVEINGNSVIVEIDGKKYRLNK